MKKGKILLIVLIVLLALTAVGLGAGFYLSHQARAAHTACRALRNDMHRQYEASALQVREANATVGSFPLSALRRDDVGAQIDALFTDTELSTDAQFLALPLSARLSWYRGEKARPTPAFSAAHGGEPLRVALDGSWDFTPVLDALEEKPRRPAQDAYAVFSDGAYELVSEQPGNELACDVITSALSASLEGVAVCSDAPAQRTFELTGCDCYLPPALTTQSAFDYDALLQRDAADLHIDVTLFDETLSVPMAPYLTANEKGQAQVKRRELTALLNAWQEQYTREGVSYVFSSYDRGEVEIPFLSVDYRLDVKGLYELLASQLVLLDATPIDAPTVCFDADGAPFDVAQTYIAVDKEAQTITFYKDGQLIVHSDVVTGLPWAGRSTPTGLYDVVNKETDCWLTGEDFYVFVKYWVGFVGTLYGLHDANWRQEGAFGGEIYKTNGSHGCVNIPEVNMEKIFNNVEVGMPVLVFE